MAARQCPSGGGRCRTHAASSAAPRCLWPRSASRPKREDAGDDDDDEEAAATREATEKLRLEKYSSSEPTMLSTGVLRRQRPSQIRAPAVAATK
mmetsp:Transcript_50489/g.130353  ORF Transcript_50489/g.130353 Transcript_50489/m.130353 type:complete len:94 (-) Transcript_50489:816-1097(-)